jgi:hypothetical protein
MQFERSLVAKHETVNLGWFLLINKLQGRSQSDRAMQQQFQGHPMPRRLE